MRGHRVPGPEGGAAHQGNLDVYLVRHAVAHERDPGRWPDDRLRPLTSKGEEDFRHAARELGRLQGGIRAVLSSPLTRAWQTACLLESEGGWPPPRKFPELAPETPSPEILHALAAREEVDGARSVALVGHRPSLHELASYMISGDPHGVELKIKKGGVVVVRFRDGLEPEAGVLCGLLPPGLFSQSV